MRVVEPIADLTFYHVFNRGNNRQTIFCDDADYRTFIDGMKVCAKEYRVEVPIYTLMPNHFHFLARQLECGSMPSMMAALCTATAMRFNSKYDHIGHVFQGRYKYKPLSEELLWGIASYIHLNPVKALLSDEPASWKYSNYSDYASGQIVYHSDTPDQRVDFDRAYVDFVRQIKADKYGEKQLMDRLRMGKCLPPDLEE